jgi:hypothetical protein
MKNYKEILITFAIVLVASVVAQLLIKEVDANKNLISKRALNLGDKK